MGYTQYWYRKVHIQNGIYHSILHDFQKLLPFFDQYLISWERNFTINENQIILNGIYPYQTFFFPQSIHPTSTWIRRGEYYFQSCETGGEDYDTVVTSFLIIAKYYLKDQLIIESDGENEEWEKAKKICHAQLGYGSKFSIEEDRHLLYSNEDFLKKAREINMNDFNL